MAVVKHSANRVRGGNFLVSWEGIAQGDTADEALLPEYTVRSIHVLGTFTGASAIALAGSNDPDLSNDNFVTLKDQVDDALSFSSAGLRRVEDNPYRIKPVLSDGDGDTDLDVHLLVVELK